MKSKTTIIPRRTATGATRYTPFLSNSNAVKKYERRGRVVWSGGTKIGSFKEGK